VKQEILKKIEIKNKRASFDFEFIERYIAGVMLKGTEIKAIRLGKANINDAYCVFERNELFIRNMNVSEYDWGSYTNHDPRRDRKLLLQRKELNKLERKAKDKGLTIVAIKLFVNDKGLAKIDIALAKGKKEFDKREDLKQKDAKREMAKAMKV
jgi:SsrA-binding protein